ncbi:MAG: transporter [Legionellales bacterium]|nr:transporter [Legionellales bacterium]
MLNKIIFKKGKGILKWTHLSVLVFFFLSTEICLASDSPVETLSLGDAIEQALQSNPNISSMEARYRALTYLPEQAGALPDPMLMLNAMNVPTDTFNTNQEAMTQMQVGISQALPFPGKRSLRKKIKHYEAEAAYYSVEELRKKIVNDVKQSWLDLFFLDKAISVTQNNQDLMRQLIETARKKYEVGKGLQQDVLLAQLELSRLLEHGIMLQNMRKHQQIKLNILMDNPVDTIVVLDEDLPELQVSSGQESTIQQNALETRSSLAEKKEQFRASEASLALAKKGYYPDFKVSVLYGKRRDTPLGAKRTDFMSVMLNASVPLYAGSKQANAIKQKQHELEKNRLTLKSEQNKVHMEVAMALADLTKAQEQFQLLDAGILPQARQTVASMMSAYQVSKVDFLNLVRSQISLFNYELQYWQAKIDIHKSEANITQAIGKEY